jgi:hypothetical protein
MKSLCQGIFSAAFCGFDENKITKLLNPYQLNKICEWSLVMTPACCRQANNGEIYLFFVRHLKIADKKLSSRINTGKTV